MVSRITADIFQVRGGALLFSNIRAADNATDQHDELFLKIEPQGVPGFFSSTEKWEGGVRHFTNIFRAIRNCVLHGVSFINTRRSQDKTTLISYKEHIHKDGLKKNIWQPFEALVNYHFRQDKKLARSILSAAKEHGVGKVEAFLKTIPIDVIEPPDVAAAREKLADAVAQLYASHPKHTGIGRRGNEIHLVI